MLLKSVDDLILYLGRAVMAASTDEFLQAYINEAQETILERAVGPEILADLEQFRENQGIEPKKTILLTKTQRALAWFAYLKYLPFSIGNDGDNGLQELGTDSTQPVRIGVLDRRIRETEKNAVAALEAVLVYLEENIDHFPAYKNSETAKATRALFVPSATVMSEFLPQIDGNYRLFLNMRPYIKLAERDFVLPRIGKAQYDRLKEGLVAGDLSLNEQVLLSAIRRALALTAYYVALPNLQFAMISNGNIRVLSDFDGIYNSKAIDNETIMSLVRSAETEAKKWQNALRAYLVNNIALFPLYAESQASKTQPTNKLPDNSQYSSIFRMK